MDACRLDIKNEIQITTGGSIIYISKSKPGSMHDFKIRKQSDPLPPENTVPADSASTYITATQKYQNDLVEDIHSHLLKKHTTGYFQQKESK